MILLVFCLMDSASGGQRSKKSILFVAGIAVPGGRSNPLSTHPILSRLSTKNSAQNSKREGKASFANRAIPLVIVVSHENVDFRPVSSELAGGQADGRLCSAHVVRRVGKGQE